MSITVDATGFLAMTRELSRLSGKSFRHVMLNQAGKVLETAIKYTPQAKPAEVKYFAGRRESKRFNTYASGDTGQQARATFPHISISSRKNKVWWVDKSEAGVRTFYIMNGNRRWSDEMWAKFVAEENDRRGDLKVASKTAIERAVKAIGLSRQSWKQIADSLGIQLKIVGAGRIGKAMPSNGRIYQNGVGTEIVRGDAFFIELLNRYPALMGSMNGHAILQRAINTRLKAFKIDLSKGVFDNIKLRASRYKGIFVT